jgi:hypothetical protein
MIGEGEKNIKRNKQEEQEVEKAFFFLRLQR